MHEMSLCEGIRRVVDSAAAAPDISRVTRVRLTVGRFAGVEKPALLGQPSRLTRDRDRNDRDIRLHCDLEGGTAERSQSVLGGAGALREDQDAVSSACAIDACPNEPVDAERVGAGSLEGSCP